MGQKYSQLGLEERGIIGLMRADGHSLDEIAASVGRSKSTISRELKRNSKPTKHWSGGYEAVRADSLATRRRRWDCRLKLARQPELRVHVEKHLAMGHSPEQIAGRLALERSTMQISYESIYRYAYYLVVSHKDYSWTRLLPRCKSRRGKLGKRGGSPASFIKNRVSIHNRPASIDTRKAFGHWEADLMAFAHNKQNILVMSERKSRIIIARKLPNKSASTVLEHIQTGFKDIPAKLRRTITYDNGTEFAQHSKLNATYKMKSYFCDTHSPWQKGGVENGIGRLRKPLPRGSTLAAITQHDLDTIVEMENNTPRKCLGYLTPNEVWAKALKSSTVALQPLHFNRECISQPSLG
jgi:transposase, IS30 family